MPLVSVRIGDGTPRPESEWQLLPATKEIVILKIVFLWIEDSGSQAADSNGGAETASETDATTPNGWY